MISRISFGESFAAANVSFDPRLSACENAGFAKKTSECKATKAAILAVIDSLQSGFDSNLHWAIWRITVVTKQFHSKPQPGDFECNGDVTPITLKVP
jgi:hypothetical protein